jgi:hypothetical protein
VIVERRFDSARSKKNSWKFLSRDRCSTEVSFSLRAITLAVKNLEQDVCARRKEMVGNGKGYFEIDVIVLSPIEANLE